jgi:hypothetical protein
MIINLENALQITEGEYHRLGEVILSVAYRIRYVKVPYLSFLLLPEE